MSVTGPWFEHVSPTMLGTCALLPRAARGMLYADVAAGDVRPHPVRAPVLAAAGALGEALLA